jgi:lipoate-protein ligase A
MKRKLVKMLRWICDDKKDAITNMSLDEAIFNNYNNTPVLRTYLWDGRYTTIGYFQKAKEIKQTNFVRRFTGGLTVNHKNDISYCFIVSSICWDVYNEVKTYKNIHLAIKNALKPLNINPQILTCKGENVNNMCVNSFCENDLFLNNKKIVGSCLRRRLNKVIIQGSVHLKLNDVDRSTFTKHFAKNLAEHLNTKAQKDCFYNKEIEIANILAKEKYSTKNWNNKF